MIPAHMPNLGVLSLKHSLKWGNGKEKVAWHNPPKIQEFIEGSQKKSARIHTYKKASVFQTRWYLFILGCHMGKTDVFQINMDQ